MFKQGGLFPKNRLDAKRYGKELNHVSTSRRVCCGRCGEWVEENDFKAEVSMCENCWYHTLHMYRSM